MNTKKKQMKQIYLVLGYLLPHLYLRICISFLTSHIIGFLPVGDQYIMQAYNQKPMLPIYPFTDVCQKFICA